jgi:DNA-binding beta-propeller fold protein YncE
MRRVFAVLALLVLAGGFAGCGGNFKLPTESRDRVIPSDKSYQMVASWTGMTGIRDILLTQGMGTQLFLLFNHGGVGTAPRGEVLAYARLKPSGPQAPLPGIVFRELFNPTALCAGGDGGSGSSNRVFVLDEGDTLLARANPGTHVYGDTTGTETTWRGKWRSPNVSDLGLYWRVREYGLLGGDTISTFTDTSMAFVHGIAADAQGRVYVAGPLLAFVRDILNPTITTRTFLWRVNRYVRGPKYPGIYDGYMPGCNWHKDTSFVVLDGSGTGTVQDPRGIFWGPFGPSLYVADFGKNWIQRMQDQVPVADFKIEQAEGISLYGPLDVTADPKGFIYLVDTGNQRVLRFDGSGEFVQTVNVEKDAYGQLLISPVTVAADDSLVFVGDAGLSEVIRYKRRP